MFRYVYLYVIFIKLGKSSYLHFFLSSHSEILWNGNLTIGCCPLLYYHNYYTYNNSIPYFIEFFDIGCNRKYENSRNVFYNNINGILLFFDLSNYKSYNNIKKWIKEIVNHDKIKSIQD